MEQAVVLLIAAGAIGLIAWNAMTMTRFGRDYRFLGTFAGVRRPCLLTFATAEAGRRCEAGADPAALYLFSDRPPDRRRWYSGGLKQDLRIPWKDLEVKRGIAAFHRCVWFHLWPRKVHFYLPLDVGLQLLNDAGRPLSDDA